MTGPVQPPDARSTELARETIGIIGVGHIARALVEGLSDGPLPRPQIRLSPRGAATSALLADRFANVVVCENNVAVAEESSVLIVAVRPDQAGTALREVHGRADLLVVSLMAGVQLSALRDLVGVADPIVRAMPLPAVRRRTSITVIHPDHPVVAALFERLGGSLPLPDEAAFDVFSAMTATMSSYFGVVATIADWAVSKGIDSVLAQSYVRSMFVNLALTLNESDRLAPQLVEDHQTRGGLNEQVHRRWLLDGGADALRGALDEILARVSTGR